MMRFKVGVSRAKTSDSCKSRGFQGIVSKINMKNTPHTIVRNGLSQVCGAQASQRVVVSGKNITLSVN